MREPEKEGRTFLDIVEDLDSYTHTALTQSNFPRYQRFVLCAEISRLVDEVFTLAIRCKKGYVQKSTLQNMDIALEKLRYKIRESAKKGYISLERKHKWMRRVDEIGRMLGGWMKKLDSKEK